MKNIALPSWFDRLVPRPVRNFRRLMVVGWVLAKNMMAYTLDYWELNKFLPGRVRRDLETTGHRQPVAALIRKSVEELGPTYVKAAQVLSTRPDILPREVLSELKKLQDTVSPFPFAQIEAIIQREMGKPLEEIFETFEERPLASASIGQVHRARLLSGNDVVVKVQRPGIRVMIESDVDIMRRLCQRLERYFEWARRYNLVERVEEFDAVIRNEMDYTYEAQNADRFRKNFENEPRIHIPQIYWDYTTPRVLTMERITGIRLNDIDRLKSQDYNLSELAEIIGDSYIKQILIDGFFHADPHPGNIFVVGHGRVALIDFGMVGIVDNAMRKAMARYFTAIVNKDAQTFVEVLDEITTIHPDTDREKLAREVGKIIMRFSGQKLGQIRLDLLIPELMDLSFRYQVTLPGEFAVMDKTLITLEGLGRLLDPAFDLMTVAQPAARMLLRRELGGEDMRGMGARLLVESRDFLMEMPRLTHKLLRELGKGHLVVGVRDTEAMTRLEKQMRVQSHLLNRLGFLLGALGVGAVVLLSLDQPKWFFSFQYGHLIFGGLLLLWGTSLLRARRFWSR